MLPAAGIISDSSNCQGRPKVSAPDLSGSETTGPAFAEEIAEYGEPA